MSDAGSEKRKGGKVNRHPTELIVALDFPRGDRAFELCKRLATSIGNTFPGEGLVLLAEERCFLTIAQLARGEKPGA